MNKTAPVTNNGYAISYDLYIIMRPDDNETIQNLIHPDAKFIVIDKMMNRERVVVGFNLNEVQHNYRNELRLVELSDLSIIFIGNIVKENGLPEHMRALDAYLDKNFFRGRCSADIRVWDIILGKYRHWTKFYKDIDTQNVYIEIE